jgi:hypothetical protein
MSRVAQAKTQYARALKERVTLRRFIPGTTGANRPRFDAEGVRARTVGYEPHELVGAIVQGDRKIIVYADDLIAKGFTLPVTTADQVIVRGKPLSIQAVDDSTRRIDSELIAIELQVRG